MAKKSKLNFLDSLLGGAARGFQFSQQLKDKQRSGELQERKFGIQEQQLGLNERQIAIQEQQAEATRQKNKRTLEFLTPLIQGIFPSSGQQPAQAPVPQQQAPAPVAQARTQAIQQPAPAFLPGQFPTTPGSTPVPSVQDRVVSDLVKTESELEKALRRLNIKERGDEASVALDTIEQNPQSITQLKRARTAKELIATQKQQSLEAETLPQVINDITKDLNLAPESRFGPGATTTPVPEALAPATQQPDIGLQQAPVQDTSSQFPRFNAELQRIRKLQGLPSDFKVSGKDAGLPFDFSVVPDDKKTIKLLKRQFIADQKGRKIEDFDILKFKGLIDSAGIRITDNFQKDLDKEFEKQFRQGTKGRDLAKLNEQERISFERDKLTDTAADFGFVPDKFKDRVDAELAGLSGEQARTFATSKGIPLAFSKMTTENASAMLQFFVDQKTVNQKVMIMLAAVASGLDEAKVKKLQEGSITALDTKDAQGIIDILKTPGIVELLLRSKDQ